MAEHIWNGDLKSNWFDADDWLPAPGVVPQPGDAAVIASGVAKVAAYGGGDPTVSGVAITLGGPLNQGDVVKLVSQAATFLDVPAEGLDMSLTVTTGSGGWKEPVRARFVSYGNTTFEGRIDVEALNGTLTLAMREAADGTAGQITLLAPGQGSNAGPDALTFVSQESALRLQGGTVDSQGLLQVEGHLWVGAGASLIDTAGTRKAPGIVELADGGRMLVAGAVGTVDAPRNLLVALPDGSSTLVLKNPAAFHATIGFGETTFGPTGGSRVDLPNVDAGSLGVSNGLMILYSGENQTGDVLARLPVGLVNPNDLQETSARLTAADFTLGDLGHDGTRITYAPQGPVHLETSLPVPIVAAPGSYLRLDDVLRAAFGTDDPGFYAVTLLPTVAPRSDIAYWGQAVNGEHGVAPAWFLGGDPVTGATLVTADQFDEVELLAGNNVDNPPQIQVQLTPDATGNSAVLLDYDIWTVDPRVAAKVVEGGAVLGQPTPTDVVNAANAFAEVFPSVVNTNLCNWIADNVAAGVGATMPFPNAALEPDLNAEGGFWRIAYRGSSSADPDSDWGDLVQPGDIVRMEWTSGAGHTTTVLGAVGSDDEITVYDNADGGQTGVHDADYWTKTAPAGITIYRLDPNQQYLVAGTSRDELVRGTVFDDLLRPAGGCDTVAGGSGDDVVQGTGHELRHLTLAEFGSGDGIDFTDVDPSAVTTRYAVDPDTGHAVLRVYSEGQRVAAVTLLDGNPCWDFTVASDDAGGTLIQIEPTSTTDYLLL